MIVLTALALLVLVSCLVSSMYDVGGYVHRPDPSESRWWESDKTRPGRTEKRTEVSDLEAMTLKDFPATLDKAPKGLLAELYVKKETYIRKDLAKE